MKKSKPTIGKILGHLVEMNKNQQEANRQLHDEIHGLVEMNKSQQEGNRQLQDQIRELVDMNRNQQEGFQQFFQMLTNQRTMFPQQHERHQVTAGEVPRLSIGPLEDSDTSGNYIPEEYTEYDKIEMTGNTWGSSILQFNSGPSETFPSGDSRLLQDSGQKDRGQLPSGGMFLALWVKKDSILLATVPPAVPDWKYIPPRSLKDSDTGDEGTSNGGVTSTNERQTLPSQTTKKSLTPKSSGNYRKCKEGSSSAVIKKLLRKQTIPIICKKTKGEFYRNEIEKKGVPSICSKGKWFFPGEFELLSGNEKSKNWKKSIYIDMKRLKKHSNMSDDDLTKLGRITLYDLFMQTKQKLPNQKVRISVIMKSRHLFKSEV
ncbi:uncharacterized protein LOC114661932 [Erpetoichthys calabaricus]|uniref:uncharacterized protein LOC114661932 n=1 Tax=Erpetoichthys calabaricus TaxID=27687 RepID=UPI002234CE8E|nr:uncharacterized protein LOC114661932 [Erpetoichthys calabaricus]